MNRFIMCSKWMLFLIIGFLFCSLTIGEIQRPNFVLVLTDDQDLLLDGLVPLEITRRLIADEGATFSNFFVNSPICCPSRSTILTGKHVHNTGVVNNSLSGNCSGRKWQQNDEKATIAALLKSDNYTNFYAGKYLNKYGDSKVGGLSHVPKGYDWWIGLKGNSKYYDYELSINGTAKKFEKDQYLTDVIKNYALDFLNHVHKDMPFFMMIAPPAAHAPFTAAKRHETKFPLVKAKRTQTFNATPIHKHWLMQLPPINLPSNVDILDNIQRHRLQTLLAVDELVDELARKLMDMHIFNNTYFIFTSDNGFHIGQFSQPWDKRQPYETDIRVPFFIKGPNISRKTLINDPSSTVDLAPTILDLADVKIPMTMDGISMKDILLKRTINRSRQNILIEYHGEGNANSVDNECPWAGNANLAECNQDNWCKCEDSRNNTYVCLRRITNIENIKFCRFFDDEDFIEYYDFDSDPHEMTNLWVHHKIISKKYHQILNTLMSCKGVSCTKAAIK
ncbi:PREDICTED: N-acetylglucosamine-6-sulfatase-like [Nicrophorus vespilloides]|uniref:N-acetylglucosamine-6-sulfatase-like n=1 Tax=Nicrophorus vespilloides TaxID=110193 RepID=A0ABM1N3X2_NICVS|nr:PREDICTED: N-acetylglucosamine-6-sulfatase-like [Nicrophorus vespilloides]